MLAAHYSQVVASARAVAMASPARLTTVTAGRQQFSSIGFASKQTLLLHDSLRHSGLLQWPPPLQRQVSPHAFPIKWQNIFYTAKRTFASKKVSDWRVPAATSRFYLPQIVLTFCF